MRLWSVLERRFDLLAVMSEWRELLGDEFQYAKQRYLRPTDRIAEIYPCPSPGGENCPRGVVEHGYDDFVAYCREIPKRCETIELKRADVILHEFDLRRLARNLAEALKLKSNKPNPEVKPSRPLKLGELQISSFRNIPVFLLIRTPFLDPHPVIQNLYMETSSPLLILATSPLNLKYQWLNSWRSNGVVAMEISTLMDRTAAGDWRILYHPEEVYHNALQPPAISIPSKRKAVLVIDKTMFEARFRGEPLKLATKDFDILVFLAERISDPPSPVGKDILYENFGGIAEQYGGWANPEILDKHIHRIREAIKLSTGDNNFNAKEILKNFYKRGYGLTIPIGEVLIKP